MCLITSIQLAEPGTIKYTGFFYNINGYQLLEILNTPIYPSGLSVTNVASGSLGVHKVA